MRDSVAQGFGFGVGSELARNVVDSLLGRSSSPETKSEPTPAPKSDLEQEKEEESTEDKDAF
jgi:hypothetical protein